MRFASVCSGCGGFDLGLEQAGLRCVVQIEINKQCFSVLEKHWPYVKRLKDLYETKAEDLPAVDVFAGGTPCQDLSISGRRAGLDGSESRLFYEFVRLADSQPAAAVLWENVPGAFTSSEGEDFAIILRELSGYYPSVPIGGWRNSGFCVGH